MVLVKTCCGVLSLKIGTIIIGSCYSLHFSSTLIFTICLRTMGRINDIYMGINIFTDVTLFIISLLLILAAFQKWWKLMMVWFGSMIIGMTVTVIEVVLQLSMGEYLIEEIKDFGQAGRIIEAVFSVISILLQIAILAYCCIVVYSFAQEIRNRQHEAIPVPGQPYLYQARPQPYPYPNQPQQNPGSFQPNLQHQQPYNQQQP